MRKCSEITTPMYKLDPHSLIGDISVKLQQEKIHIGRHSLKHTRITLLVHIREDQNSTINYWLFCSELNHTLKQMYFGTGVKKL